MSKRIRYAVISFALATVVALSVALSACTIKTNHPRAKISVSFNSVEYNIEYMLYRNMYPQTVQHFIELADAEFYDNMIIHDYTTTDWMTGAYAYDADSYDTSKGFAEYLDAQSKEKSYYELASSLTHSVYTNISYDKNGNEYVDEANALPTLIGEFSANDHNIDKGALSASFGKLKMMYYDKGSSNHKVAIKNSFGQILEHDYKYNCATSVFSMQVGSGSSYSAANYCVFGDLLNDSARDELEKLLDAISDYITNNLGGSSNKFTSSIATTVDNEDKFANWDGGSQIEKSFTATSMPIIIKSVTITKY